MDGSLQAAESPELIFGLVAPIGVDLEMVCEVLRAAIESMAYKAAVIRLTSLMNQIPVDLPLGPTHYIESYRRRIAYANEVRKKLGDDALAVLAISAIRGIRRESHQSASKAANPSSTNSNASFSADPEDIPLSKQAYIVRQFKRPEEISLLRSVYGRQFIAISTYTAQEKRLKRIEDLELKSQAGQISQVEAHNRAFEIVSQDSNEIQDIHGQNVRDAFPLGDVFVDATSRKTCEESTVRFIKLLFGNNQITPTKDEYGMYMAKSASLRSSDLSRQVGAAIFSQSSEIISLGCNEVPKSSGGTYWPEDAGDSRDFVQGSDPNEGYKNELLVDVIGRLLRGGSLNSKFDKNADPQSVLADIKKDEASSISESKLMDIIEFGRIIHAEMSAICDAARNGNSIRNATLYCTTFPCHICAKHIISAGISRVVYLEPYPKSYAERLHKDALAVESDDYQRKVLFKPFIGISPFRYRDLFEKGKRKYSGGVAQEWNKGKRRPMIDVYYPSYFEAENYVLSARNNKMNEIMKG